MKIFFVHSLSPLASKGGAEVSLRFLTQALAQAGHQCVVLVTAETPGIRRIKKEGVKIVEVGLRNVYSPFDGEQRTASKRLIWHGIDSYNPLMGSVVSKICAQERPDVASVHNLAGWSIAAWQALREQHVPIVQVLHDQYLLCAASTMFRDGQNCRGRCRSCRLLRIPHRAQSRKLSAVVGVSRFILDHHRQAGYFNDVPIQRVIHNARSKRELGAGNQRRDDHDRIFRYGFIGSITPAKGVKPLLEAFERSRLRAAELWVAGDCDSEYARSLRDGVTDPRILFMGRTKPADFFPRIDALVLPSLWRDTYPGVAFESLIFGRPVIAVSHGGAPEIISHERNGLIFDPDQPDALPDCLERLAENPELLRNLSENAGIDGAEYLDTDRWVGQYIAVYRDALRETEVSPQ